LHALIVNGAISASDGGRRLHAAQVLRFLELEEK
jgi:hypothetical protein